MTEERLDKIILDLSSLLRNPIDTVQMRPELRG
jgi:hypothetical protein